MNQPTPNPDELNPTAQERDDGATLPLHCPLCLNTVTLHTPNGARAHFTTVHPEQRLVDGPWPVLVPPTTDEDAQRSARRISLRVLLNRLNNRLTLTTDEAQLLTRHVATEMADANAGRRRGEQADAVTAEAKRLMERRTTTLRERAEQAEAFRVAVFEALGLALDQLPDVAVSAIRGRGATIRDLTRRAERAEAAIADRDRLAAAVDTLAEAWAHQLPYEEVKRVLAALKAAEGSDT